MEESPDLKPSSCIPCAKRKVRCDRKVPCCHCKRRKLDTCEYPLPIGRVAATKPENDLLKQQQARIEQLEKYISENGGDPRAPEAHSTTATGDQTLPAAKVAVDSSSKSYVRGRKRDHEGNLLPTQSNHFHEDVGLVELDKQSTYIESPVWYSWSEARKPGNDSVVSQQSQHNPLTGYHTTILDWPKVTSNIDLLHQHPDRPEIEAIWRAFLRNVHPVVKIFFAWDKASMISLAAHEPSSLSRGQHTLCFAIYFVSTLSLLENECKEIFSGSTRASALDKFQTSVEAALVAADYSSSSDLLVLQALVLYLVAMRNRAKPATFFSLMGIATRTAQRLGLHREGSLLGLPPMRAEERRRMWWQMQYLEIAISQIVGCISMTLYAAWDTKLPANLEDDDIRPELTKLPPERPELTSMSHCLWRYLVLNLFGAGSDAPPGAAWLASSKVLRSEKDAVLEQHKRVLSEKFLQHCEPVDPLHAHVQIGIQSYLLAMQRGARQPGVAAPRITEMPQSDRDGLLRICTKAMEYFILAETTPSIAHFRWHNENYFQWTALVYILIEARHRASKTEASGLWQLINRVCEVYPKLTTAIERPEVYAIARLVILAWQERQANLQEDKVRDQPWCVSEIERALNLRASNRENKEVDSAAGSDDFDAIDFDLIDWSLWEAATFAQPG